MKSKLFAERGQALVLIALAAIGLFGVAGLAIDGSAKFSDRRHAQNAADTAALAGVLAMARGQAQWDLDALDRALENGYDDNHVSNEVEVYNPPQSGIYANCSDAHFDCHDYVQVIIDSHVDTFFARVVGIMQTHNHVEAVASKISENNSFNFGGNAVVALAPEGCALMSQGGTNLTVIGGGLYSNSDDATCSFKKDSCAGTTNIDSDTNGTQGTITMVGGASINTGCPPDAGLAPAGTKQLPFPPPYQEITPPAECSQPLVDITGNPSSVTLSPGHYAQMPPKNNMKDITLQPGVYCIDTEIRIGSQDTFVINNGTFPTTPGVFLYIKPGGSFTFNAGSTVQIWAINDASVAADSSLLPYKNYLIYAAPDYASGTPATCTINGGALSMFKGTIYAPYCNMTVNGGSGSTGFQSQLIGYKVKFSGTSDIYLNYDANSNPTWSIPLQVGLSK
jgi:hypothetical protein